MKKIIFFFSLLLSLKSFSQTCACYNFTSDITVSGHVIGGPVSQYSFRAGYNALKNLTTGASDLAIGDFALQALTTASYVTALGPGAGDSTNVDTALYIGLNAGYGNTKHGVMIIGQDPTPHVMQTMAWGELATGKWYFNPGTAHTPSFDPSVQMEMFGTNGGTRLDAMTTTQKNAIPVTAASDGIFVYDKTLHEYDYYNSNTATWMPMAGNSVSSGTFTPTASSIVNASTISFGTCSYIKAGNTVHVLITGSIQTTATGAVSFKATLPFTTTKSPIVICGVLNASSSTDGHDVGGEVNILDSDKIRLNYVNYQTLATENFTTEFDYQL